MLKSLLSLTKLQLKNLYGINVFLHTKDPKEKRKKIFQLIAYAFVFMILAFYVGAMSLGYVLLGLESILPAYLIMITSVIIMFFSFFKAGNVIFDKNGFDILSSLPFSNSALVISRFIRMYVENISLSAAVMVPAIAVFALLTQPALSFYIIGFLVMLFIPFLPITLSVFVGALITAVSSRFKHKSIASTVISLAFVIVIMVGSFVSPSMEDATTVEALQNMLPELLKTIGRVYPPAIWLGDAMLTGNFLVCFAVMLGAFAIFSLVIALVAVSYSRISQALYHTSAKHDYKMQTLQSTSRFRALFMREWKRYISCSAYVTNTLVSPIMGLLLSGAIFFAGADQVDAFIAEMQVGLGFAPNVIAAIPFVLASVFCLMPTTATSVSLEGKQWWIVKSLPVSAKELFDAKILLNLALFFPFYAIAEVLLILALRPTVLEIIWLLLVPAISITSSCIFGLFANLRLPVFNWENEITVVKQSASSFVGGFVGCLVLIVCAVVMLFVPSAYVNLAYAILCGIITLIGFLLYQHNNRTDLTRY